MATNTDPSVFTTSKRFNATLPGFVVSPGHDSGTQDHPWFERLQSAKTAGPFHGERPYCFLAPNRLKGAYINDEGDAV